MKRILTLAALILCVCMGSFASEQLDLYTWLYGNATSMAERYAVIKIVSEERMPDAGPLYQRALKELLEELPNINSSNEREMAEAFSMLLAGSLGDIKFAASANDLWKLSETFSNPVVKSEIYTAIGRTRSADHLQILNRILSDLNAAPATDRLAAEKVAFGTLLALEKFRDISSYPIVFFASIGWYSRRVKDQAAATLPLLTDDPSEALKPIIRTNNTDIKLIALHKSEESNAPAASKAEIALLTLQEGWRIATSDMKERQLLSQLRKQSMQAMLKHGVPNASLKELERCYKEGLDLEEKLTAVSVLTANKSDAAAAALASFLMILNNKQRDGRITQDDERLVRAVIPAIGTVGNRVGKTALQAVEYMNWTPTIQRLAKESLDKLR
jgi:hypothetical protein